MELAANSSGINISDVIEVIETDRKMDMGRREGPYIKIVEQPASKALRFRYECEGRSAGSIPGVNSSPENKTYPTIQIVGYKGCAVVVVSCVTKESPYRPHPHNLVGREGCKKGVCTLEVSNDSMTQSFDHLGIQCVKKKDIEEALRVREDIRVDPFRTGFSHRTQPGSIDLNAVRLCFQAFLEDEPGSRKFKIALMPVVSDIIYDKKALCDLAICKLSHCSAPVAGGLEMILLCEKVAKEDISVRLFERRNNQVVWEGLGDFTPTQVHKQVAITFKTPRYKTLQVENPVEVFIQLRRPSDGETSEALPFLLTPLDSGGPLGRKRPKVDHEVDSVLAQDKESMRGAAAKMSPRPVKLEPADTSPNPYSLFPGGPSPIMFRTVSPMEHQGMTYESSNVTYTTASASAAPLGALSPPMVALSLPLAQPQVGRVSPHVYLPISNNMYTLDPGTIVETVSNGTYRDISFSIPGLSSEPMENLNINSKDLNELLDEGNLSENLSNNLSLNTDSNQAKKTFPQENMTDSLTRIANSAYDGFVEHAPQHT